MSSDELLSIYDPVIRGTVSEFLRNKPHRLRQDREDMIQECRIRLWKVAHRADPTRNLRAYVRRVCWQVCNRYAAKLAGDAIYDAVQLPEDEEYD